MKRTSLPLALILSLSAAATFAQTQPPATRPLARPAAPVVLNPDIPNLPPPPTSTATPHVNTATIPYPQFYDEKLAIARGNISEFNRLHKQNLARAKKGTIDVLFLGDSITQFWSSAGRLVWAKEFADPKFANFGVSADRTQNILWRLQNGEAEGYTPKVVILMAGTNNLGLEVDGKTARNTAPEIADGIKAIITDLHIRWPDAKVLLFGILPRGEKDNVAREPMRKYAADVNELISKFDDGKYVTYADIGAKFLDAEGKFPTGMMSDTQQIHPAQKGYEIWAQAITERLPALLGGASPTPPR